MFVAEDYEKVFLELGFTELDAIKKDIENGYYISHGKIADKEVVVRVLTKTDKTRVKNYEKELAIFKILEKGIPKGTLSQFACTRKIGENEKFIWSIRDYVDGEVVSLYNTNKLLMGYDEIDSKLLGFKDEIITSIKENLRFLWSIEESFENDLFQERFSRIFDSQKIASVEKGIDYSLSEQISFYKKNVDKVFVSNNIKPSFGDLIPANIIYSNKKAVFLDFEWFSFDHYLADVSFLWLYLWRYPSWQKKLLDSIITTEEENVSFCVNLIRQIIGFYSDYIFNSNDVMSKSVLEKRAFFPNHIWTRYLKATHSYSELLKVK